MPPVDETELPGVGTRFSFETEEFAEEGLATLAVHPAQQLRAKRS